MVIRNEYFDHFLVEYGTDGSLFQVEMHAHFT